MHIFDHPNFQGGFECPICKTSEDKAVVLIGILGTEEGSIMQARQYHVGCLELIEQTFDKAGGKEVLVFQRYKG